MAVKHYIYDNARRYIFDKDTYVNQYINNSLTKTQSLFKWENLPEEIEQRKLEEFLQTSGNVGFFKYNDTYYALKGGVGGPPDAYNEGTQYIIASPALNLEKEYTIGKDIVLIRNDYSMTGILPILYKYAVLMCDTEITLDTVAVLNRITMLISASDDKTKQSADIFIDKILKGDFTVIAEQPFLNGVRYQSNTHGTNNNITQIIELLQYLKASALNEIGLNANYNMKRERVNAEEIALNIDALIPFVSNMLKCRQFAVDQINKMFGLNISVDFDTVWKTTYEEMEKETDSADILESDQPGGPEEESTEHDDS